MLLVCRLVGWRGLAVFSQGGGGTRRRRVALRRCLPRSPVELANVATTRSDGNGAKGTVRGLGTVIGEDGGLVVLGTLRDASGNEGGNATLSGGSASALDSGTDSDCVAVVGSRAVGARAAGESSVVGVGGVTTALRRSVRRMTAS